MDEAVRLDPGFADAFNGRGFAYLGKQQYDRAIQDFDEAIRLDPAFASAFNNRGTAYNGKGQYQRAIEDLNEAIRLNPTFVTASINRETALRNLAPAVDANADSVKAKDLKEQWL